MRMRRRRPNEGGAVIALIAASLLVLIAMAAIVVDLGNTRTDRRTLSSSADFSVLAAGATMGDRYASIACRDAVEYLAMNIPQFAHGADPCDGLPTVCVNPAPPTTPTPIANGALPTSVTKPTDVMIEAGEYRATIRYPVSDADIYDPTIPYPSTRDGSPCERMRITLSHRNRTVFGQLLGIDSLTPAASATVRVTPKTSQTVPSLWLLDPYGCPALSVSGGARITVGTDTIPGVISLDTDTSLCGSSVALYSDNNSSIQALPQGSSENGLINLYSMQPSSATCGVRDCEQAKIGPYPKQIWPQPTPQLRRATRAPVDHRFNCKAGYPMYLGSVIIRDCKFASTSQPYIDALRALSGITTPNTGLYVAGTMPGGFTSYTSLGGSCNVKGNMTITGNTWINCPGGMKITGGNSITIVGNVIMDGDLAVNSGGAFRVLPVGTSPLPTECQNRVNGTCAMQSTGNAGYLLQRTAGVGMDIGGNLELRHTVVVQNGGCVKFGSGAPPRWTAPTEGPFAGLALWSEGCAGSSLSSGGDLSIAGTFFTPDATFKIAGNGDGSQQDAQFIAYRLEAMGSGTLKLAPNPSTSITLDVPRAVLIR